MPYQYRVNELPPNAIGELGNATPQPSQISRGIVKVAESIQCIGGQLTRHGDRAVGLYAALLIDHLQRNYSGV